MRDASNGWNEHGTGTGNGAGRAAIRGRWSSTTCGRPVDSRSLGGPEGKYSAMPTIRFYFDYESPNAYLAWTQLPKLAARYRATVEPVPILYAALLDAHGQLGPGEQPTKGRWMGKNMLRKAALLGVPLNPPAFLPFNPLLALRVSMLPPETQRRDALIDAHPQMGDAPPRSPQASCQGLATEKGSLGARA